MSDTLLTDLILRINIFPFKTGSLGNSLLKW